MTRIGILGSGTVGQTLAKGLKADGYEVRIASRTPAKLAEFSSAAGIATGTPAAVAARAAARMVRPSYAGGKPTMFYCGNDAAAKAAVARIIDGFGWEGADMGTAKAARAIEPLCQLWCIPGFRENSWTHAFKLLRT